MGGDPLDYYDPRGLLGFGGVVGGSIEAGALKYGVGGNDSAGGGVFGGGTEGLNLGGFASAGGYSNLPKTGVNQYPQDPVDGTQNAILGLFAGVGGGAFLTNADSANDLKGPFDTFNFNIGVGPGQFSLQFGISCGTWIISATVGPGAGVDGSRYPTNTFWGKTIL